MQAASPASGSSVQPVERAFDSGGEQVGRVVTGQGSSSSLGCVVCFALYILPRTTRTPVRTLRSRPVASSIVLPCANSTEPGAWHSRKNKRGVAIRHRSVVR